jgi:hypothetical protein
MKRIIGWERFVRAASWLSDSPARSRRRRMTAANAPHNGSSEVRGMGWQWLADILFWPQMGTDETQIRNTSL